MAAVRIGKAVDEAVGPKNGRLLREYQFGFPGGRPERTGDQKVDRYLTELMAGRGAGLRAPLSLPGNVRRSLELLSRG